MDNGKRSYFLVFNHFSIASLVYRNVTLPIVKYTCFNWQNSYDGSRQEIKTYVWCILLKTLDADISTHRKSTTPF